MLGLLNVLLAFTSIFYLFLTLHARWIFLQFYFLSTLILSSGLSNLPLIPHIKFLFASYGIFHIWNFYFVLFYGLVL